MKDIRELDISILCVRFLYIPPIVIPVHIIYTIVVTLYLNVLYAISFHIMRHGGSRGTRLLDTSLFISLIRLLVELSVSFHDTGTGDICYTKTVILIRGECLVDGCCLCCDKSLDFGYQIDHMIELPIQSHVYCLDVFSLLTRRSKHLRTPLADVIMNWV